MATKAQCIDLLRQIYERFGPKDVKDKTCVSVPPAEYARLSSEEIDNKWDFYDRHMMHEVAKAISPADRGGE